MLRETNVQRLHWADKTMSLLRQLQLESCEKRLAALPSYGLFTYDDDLRAEELWDISFDAMDQPRKTCLHTTQGLRAMVLMRMPQEAALLSVEEHSLVERLITLEGEAELLDWLEMSAAESLVRRLWCTIQRVEDRFILHMPEELRTPLLLILSERQHEEVRERLQRHDAVIRAMLYIGGLLHYQEPVYHLMNDVLENLTKDDPALVMRYLRTAYDYVFDQQGEMLLLHPGLADHEHLLATAPSPTALSLELDEDTIVGAMEGILPCEMQLFQRLCGLLDGATRPELSPEEAAEDLRMLVKQGVPLHVLHEVLGSVLAIQPTDEMLRAIDEMHRQTPRWGSFSTGCMQ